MRSQYPQRIYSPDTMQLLNLIMTNPRDFSYVIFCENKAIFCEIASGCHSPELQLTDVLNYSNFNYKTTFGFRCNTILIPASTVKSCQFLLQLVDAFICNS